MSDWQAFAKQAAMLMRQAKSNEIKLEMASDFFQRADAIKSEELRRYAEAMVWEIDGSPDFYEELIQAFEASTSEADMIAYINE